MARRRSAPLETEVTENVQASAMVFAAIESQKRGAPVNVPDFVRSFS